MQHTATSDEHVAADGGHIPSNQETAPVWTSPPVSRPPPHLEAGKVMRTIFHWESGTWQHEHERPLFDWGLLHQLRLRVSCSLPPPPISRSFTDPVAGEIMLLSFYWETGQWEHEWESGVRLLEPPGPLMEPSLSVLPPRRPPPTLSPERLLPHPEHGVVRTIGLVVDTDQWYIEYADGTRIHIPGPSNFT
jgi:hypothetical protein